MSIELSLVNPCIERKKFCLNCNQHFMKVRPFIESVAVTKRFKRDLKGKPELVSIIRDILDCSQMEFTELHKFEKNVRGNLIFRAKRNRNHIVYGVDKGMRIVFLRAILNFTEYSKLLEDEKALLNLLVNAQDVTVKEATDKTADHALKRADNRKKARFRTRGPYRKATTRFDP